MKIAVTYGDGQIFQHFGHTAQFKLYEVAEGKVVRAEVVDTNGSGHGVLAGFLMQQGVDTLICGGIGGGAAAAGLRGILEAGSIIDGTAEDPEERRKRIEAQENASNLGAVIGLAVGILTAAADSEEDMSAEENDGPTMKM